MSTKPGLQDLSTPLGRYACMALARAFEEHVSSLFSRGLIGGTSHLCIGQEAGAVGAVACLRPDDFVVSSHRGHGHFLAKGAEPAELMAELLGKRTGPCLGRGGSQHLCKKALSFYGTNGITGGGIPLATGIALAEKLKGSGRVAMDFFGEGATNQGTFHESLNMAAIWSLPVVYVCENNLYAMSTRVTDSMRVERVSERAAAYGMPGVTVDGMDVEAVRSCVSKAVERARSGAGPTLVECLCYRYCGHSKSDRLVYRTRQEEQPWRERDPLILARKRLLAGGLEEARLDALDAAVRQTVRAAYETAAAAPDPTVGDVIVSPYAENS